MIKNNRIMLSYKITEMHSTGQETAVLTSSSKLLVRRALQWGGGGGGVLPCIWISYRVMCGAKGIVSEPFYILRCTLSSIVFKTH